MEQINISQATEKIRVYLRQNNFRPYFVAVDCASAVEELKKSFEDLDQIYSSNLCNEDFPFDRDSLIDKLTALEKDAVFFGLGECIFFTAQENILLHICERTFNRKIIFVCRGISNFLKRLAADDFKFRTNHFCHVAGKEIFSVVKYNPNLDIATDAKNFTEFLRLLESGKSSVTVQTNWPLVNVKEINSYFEAIKFREPQISIPPTALEDWQWREIFFDDKCEGYPPEHWRTFARSFKRRPTIPYLNYVFEKSSSFEEYRKNLFFALLDVTDEKIFEDFYQQRKAVVKNISSEFLSEYLARLEKIFGGSEAIKYLTDNTPEECKSMIRAVQGLREIPSAFEKNFPALKDYLADYIFDDEKITTYFRNYKREKLFNVADENFNEHVQALALERPYNKFPSRQELLEKVDGRAKLYWLDALGAEFLSYIKARAQRIGLASRIKIARAELPTLTSMNKNFYDDWTGDKFDKNSKLDDLKHSPEKFDGGKCSAPIYIVDELKIIDDALDEIKNFLTRHPTEKVILTSDHGASRLAVLFRNVKTYKMQSVGEHGGRCCQRSEENIKPPLCATEENGYWVLSNYDRFAGGRMNSVEVHGGATLEEVLVPVIEFES
ncbi:MAG: BREX-4 system phosphatase PglZ [Selenomonadaceae bacterium]|nr:BREX-4 system phosphatase PglZ [Selenomonadaceae bacterium]MBR7025870.1 BREX-4 system phosphatase PglZ [Selenomonadaceae bacterium]